MPIATLKTSHCKHAPNAINEGIVRETASERTGTNQVDNATSSTAARLGNTAVASRSNQRERKDLGSMQKETSRNLK